MRELNLSEQYALIALEGQESLHRSMAKSAVLRAVMAAEVLMPVLEKKGCSLSEFAEEAEKAVQAAKNMNKKEERQIEQKVKESLEKEGLLCEIPDLLGCDLNYYSAGIELKSYRSEEQTYFRIREGLRAEILDDGEITMECLSLLWLLRESGCIHELFSVAEQERVLERVNGVAAENEYCRILWEKEFHSIFESFTGRFLRAKSKLFENPYLEGVSLAFPYLERRKAIFIDWVVFGTNVEERRSAAVDFLRKMGHNVEEVRSGSETLLKIDRMYYRIFPTTRRSYQVPIQGVNLVPVYW